MDNDFNNNEYLINKFQDLYNYKKSISGFNDNVKSYIKNDNSLNCIDNFSLDSLQINYRLIIESWISYCNINYNTLIYYLSKIIKLKDFINNIFYNLIATTYNEKFSSILVLNNDSCSLYFLLIDSIIIKSTINEKNIKLGKNLLLYKYINFYIS